MFKYDIQFNTRLKKYNPAKKFIKDVEAVLTAIMAQGSCVLLFDLTSTIVKYYNY